MEVKLIDLTIGQLVEGYLDDEDGRVIGYGGKLDIRPSFQREFVYKDKQREAVIDTIMRGFPLNVMYWADRQDGTYEIIDGQQRTISIAQYIQGDFSINGKYFHNLDADERDSINGYELMVYVCTGTHREKLTWFRIVNIAGEKLSDQELRNAVYSGPWVSDAKRYFSKTSCVAYQIAQHFVRGSTIRQDYLETAIRWVSQNNIDDYMGLHQQDEDARELWEYFQTIVAWIDTNFKTRKNIMKGVNWGQLYDNYKDSDLDPQFLEERTVSLIDDEEVENHSGIYPYLLTGDVRSLNLRTFSPRVKRRVYERQNGICGHCDKWFDIEDVEADHITPWVEGGRTIEDNCQILCKTCNRRKAAQ